MNPARACRLRQGNTPNDREPRHHGAVVPQFDNLGNHYACMPHGTQCGQALTGLLELGLPGA